MVFICDRESHIRITLRLPQFRPRKNDILHTGAPELLRALFAEHPPDGIRHIALTAPVRAYDPSDPVMKFKYEFIGKRFKPMNLYIFQIHPKTPINF